MHFVCWPSPKTLLDTNVFIYTLLHSEWSKLWAFLSVVRYINASFMLALTKGLFFKMQMYFIHCCTQNGQNFGHF